VPPLLPLVLMRNLLVVLELDWPPCGCSCIRGAAFEGPGDPTRPCNRAGSNAVLVGLGGFAGAGTVGGAVHVWSPSWSIGTGCPHVEHFTDGRSWDILPDGWVAGLEEVAESREAIMAISVRGLQKYH
jgi:hypothetical protein